ncbi:MAG TPA: hypothetical protein VJR92_08660 [Gemmatimonadaceae bacterium]|nr:hypothetical protein [Gemmatimonadaceae bacterium]
MDLTVVERLICPNDHEPTPLVVRADATAHGALTRGVLGCPKCESEWKVDGGVARFGPRAELPHASADPAVLAALLDLTEPGRLIIVDGVSAETCAALARDYGAMIVALDPPESGSYAAVIEGATHAPVSAGVARGAVLMRAVRDAAFNESIVRAVGPRGRIVGAPDVRIPRDVTEMARDDRLWVGARDDVSAPVSLRRGGP